MNTFQYASFYSVFLKNVKNHVRFIVYREVAAMDGLSLYSFSLQSILKWRLKVILKCACFKIIECKQFWTSFLSKNTYLIMQMTKCNIQELKIIKDATSPSVKSLYEKWFKNYDFLKKGKLIKIRFYKFVVINTFRNKPQVGTSDRE